MRAVMIDNYDSFSHNVAYLLKELGLKLTILTNDCNIKDISKHSFEILVISPGPSHPLQSGICLEAIKHYAPHKKILGICLGHQCIAHVFGGEVIPLENPVHGKTSLITFDRANPLFSGISSPLKVARYHSLHVSSLGNCKALAYSDDGIIMALKANCYNTYGFQFHPESILQEQGKKLVSNFLALPYN